MMAIVSLTVGNLLTNDLGFFFFFGGVFCDGNSLSAFHLKISGPADFFPRLLSLCSYRWRFVVKDKDGGYHGSRWQSPVPYPRHHDHHLV